MDLCPSELSLSQFVLNPPGFVKQNLTSLSRLDRNVPLGNSGSCSRSMRPLIHLRRKASEPPRQITPSALGSLGIARNLASVGMRKSGDSFGFTDLENRRKMSRNVRVQGGVKFLWKTANCFVCCYLIVAEMSAEGRFSVSFLVQRWHDLLQPLAALLQGTKNALPKKARGLSGRRARGGGRDLCR